MYGLTLLASRILGSALDAYARRERLYSPHEDGEDLHSDRRRLLPVVTGYLIAIHRLAPAQRTRPGSACETTCSWEPPMWRSARPM